MGIETVIRSKADFKNWSSDLWDFRDILFQFQHLMNFISDLSFFETKKKPDFSQLGLFAPVVFFFFPRGFFGMAEGEAIRLLEFEALHQALALRSGGTSGHVAILGDFNTASQSTATRQKFPTLADFFWGILC